MKRNIASVIAVLIVTAFAATMWLYALRTPGPETYWQIPEGYPLPRIPDDNPLSPAKISLGRQLFYDQRLSINGAMSCATCHIQALAFTDGRPVSIGTTGEAHPRNSMSLVNVSYASRLTWANPLLDRLEFQALTPLFADAPVEMGMGGHEAQITEMIRDDPGYRALFESAFPDSSDPFTVLNVVRAIASFVRTIVSFNSPYDRFVAGDSSAMSASQQRGLALFESERLECFHCHGGFNFSDSSTHANSVVSDAGFHNTGLYDIDRQGAYPPGNTGLYEITGKREDMGRFRAPTLRNVALTAPYMHDGSIDSLSGVIEHYRRGGRMVSDGPFAGDGSRNPYKSEFVRAFDVTDAEAADLIDFLHALTDESVLINPDFAAPSETSTQQ